ncbi:MAG: transcriptional regulator [Phycisphaeraceae bacterium]
MAELDPVIHQPVRLRIMTAMASLEPDAHVEFVYLRDRLKLTDGNLGAHLSKLEAAGYIVLDKTFVSRKPRTYVHLTMAGRQAFERHVAALQAILRNDASGGHA